MPYLLEDLIVDRVDFVDEGCNSASFIELYKRKEKHIMDVKEILSKMKPEHASVIQEAIDSAAEELRKSKEDLASVQTELDTVKADLEVLKAKCTDDDPDDKNDDDDVNDDVNDDAHDDATKAKDGSAFDETETIKSLPKEARELIEKLRSQKDAAEEEVRKAKDEKITAEAVAKAKELKAIPVEHDKLVNIIKVATPDIIDLLTVVNAAIEGTVLDEVGKSHTKESGADAWTKIEAKADEIVKRDSVTKQKAISIAIKENPELYKEYLQGGAN